MVWRVLILLGVLSTWLVGCDEDDPKPADPSPGIFVVTAPAFLLCDVESTYVYMVRVENAPEVTSVRCTVTRPNNSGELTFDLFDDGGVTPLTSPEFASGASLDVVPNNYTFTRGIRGDLLCALGEGVYSFDFAAQTAHGSLRINNVQVELRELQDCVFDNVAQFSTLTACFDDLHLSIRVTPEQGVAIDSVRASWYSGDTLWWSKVFEEADSEWQLNLAPSLFACTPSGANYFVVYEAFTRFGLNCLTTASENISFTNSMPVLSNPQMADTLYRPVTPGDPDTLEFFVRSDDCEIVGMPNTFAVLFEVSRDDMEHFGRTSDFYLRDDGVPPDLTPGDGLASSYLVVDTSSVYIDNVYYFRYFSIECSSGDTTEKLLDSVRIVRPGGIAVTPSIGSGLGISSFK